MYLWLRVLPQWDDDSRQRADAGARRHDAREVERIGGGHLRTVTRVAIAPDLTK